MYSFVNVNSFSQRNKSIMIVHVMWCNVCVQRRRRIIGLHQRKSRAAEEHGNGHVARAGARAHRL